MRSSTSSNSGSQTPPSRRLGWPGLVGLVITLLLLWWVLHDVSISEVLSHIRTANPVWFVLAVTAATLTFPLRTIRWRYLLRYEGAPLPFAPLWHATAIGFMANNLLPARAGEFARAYAARQLTGVRFSTAFASIAVERILDGITLVALLVVAIMIGGFQASATVAGMSVERMATVGGLLFGGMLLVAMIVVRWPAASVDLGRRLFHRVLPDGLATRLTAMVEGLIEGLEALRTPQRLAVVLFWSLIVWAMNATSFWLAFLAFGLSLPWSAALLLQSVIAFGVAIPSSPGFFGVFEGAARASLALYGVAATAAVSYAIGYHLGGFLPITLLGLWSLWRANLRLGELRGAGGAATE